MNGNTIAVLVQNIGSIISQVLQFQAPKTRPVEYPKIEERVEPPPAENNQSVSENSMEERPVSKDSKGTACLPCTNSHVLTCAGLLSEAARMSPDGINEDAQDRVQKCLAEFAAAERVDLAPENIVKLSPDMRKVADEAAKNIRTIRHGLEWLKSREELVQLAADTSKLASHVNKEWLKLKLKQMPAEEVKQAAVAAMDRIDNGQG
jgi:hypothetical protein